MSIDTVSDITPRVQYVALAAQSAFDYPFPIFEDADLVVDIDDVTLVLDTDYSVSGEGDDTGGAVTLFSPASGGERVTIYRESVIERITDFSPNGSFSSESFNNELDKITLVQQELKAAISRALRFSPTAEATSEDTLLAPISAWAGNYIYINEDGIPEPATAIDVTTLTQSTLGLVLNPRTAAETTAAVVPLAYRYPEGPFTPLERYGLSPSASASVNSAAVAAGVAVLGAIGTGGTLLAGSGIFATNPNVIAQDRCTIQGMGANATIWSFNQVGAEIAFHFTKGASSIVQSGIRDCGWTSANSVTKTMVKFSDSRHCFAQNLGCPEGSWLGNSSVGIHMMGRDFALIKENAISCARPCVLGVNPNYATLHVDHFMIQHNEFTGTLTSAGLTAGHCIEFEGNIEIGSLTIEYNGLNKAKNGIYWKYSKATGGAGGIDSNGLLLRNNRTEQGTDTAGYSYYFENTTTDLKSVRLEGAIVDAGRGGVFARKWEQVSISDSFFQATSGTHLDMTFTSRTELHTEGVAWNVGGAVTMTSGVAYLEAPWDPAAVAASAKGNYRYDEGGLSSRKLRREDGALKFAWAGTMANGTQLNLPILSSAGIDVAHIRFSIGSATGPILEGGGAVWRPGLVKLAGTTSAAIVTAHVGTDFAIKNDTGDALALVNFMGQTVDVALEIVAKA